MQKDGKWAKEIIALQDKEGKWSNFHSLAVNSKVPITTEQALRRLEILGYTMEDECIQKAVAYMDDCLTGKNQIPDRREKLHDWDIFTSMLLAAWIRRFTIENENANAVAQKWALIVSTAFRSGVYDHFAYVEAYHEILGKKPKGGRLIDFVQFYGVSLISDLLDKDTQPAVMDYILSKPDGIYYVYDRCLMEFPVTFTGKLTSRYLGGVEMLARFAYGKEKLVFVKDWLEENRDSDGTWDMGSKAKEYPYFPLSDDWRKAENRVADCTRRINALLKAIET